MVSLRVTYMQRYLYHSNNKPVKIKGRPFDTINYTNLAAQLEQRCFGWQYSGSLDQQILLEAIRHFVIQNKFDISYL